MRIITTDIDVDFDPEDLRHFGLSSAEQLREFINTVRIESKKTVGFKTEDKETK